MRLQEAIDSCHVRSSVFRTSKPEKKYPKNHSIKLIDRIPDDDKSADDWEEWDPRDEDEGSLYMYND